MNLPALLLLAQATLLSVRPDSQVACPTPQQVTLALASRVPAALLRPEQAVQAGALELELGRSEDGVVSLRLTGPDGGERLRRDLVTRDGSTDCSALAETVALILERFLSDLDARGLPAGGPPAPPPPVGRRWDLSLAAGWRSGADADGVWQAFGRVDRLLGSNAQFQVSLTAGLSGSAEAVPTGSSYAGQSSVRRFPVELGLWWLKSSPYGEIQLGTVGGLEITRVSSRGQMARHDDLVPAPVARIAAGLRVPLGGSAFCRLGVGLGVALVSYDFFEEAPGAPRRSVFTVPTPRFYAKMAAELGVGFPLMKKPSLPP